MTTRVGGIVVQSGLGLQPRGAPRPGAQSPGPKRGVVLATYVSDTPGRPDIDVTDNAWSTVMCDVLLLRSQQQLFNVPVMCRVFGVGNAEPWVPVGTTATTDTGENVANLNARSKRGTSNGVDLPPAERLNGDHVLVEFLNQQVNSAVIIGPWVHPATRRTVYEGAGANLSDLAATRGKPHSRERYVSHGGSEFRMTEQGDVVFDTVGANPSSKLTDDPTPGTGGDEVHNLKDGMTFSVGFEGTKIATFTRTGSSVDIRLASETASQQYMRGNDFSEAHYQWLDALLTLVDEINLAITAASGTTAGGVVIPGLALGAFDLACTVMREDAPQQYLSTRIRGE